MKYGLSLQACTPGPCEGGADVSIGPGVAAVGGLEDLVGVVVPESHRQPSSMPAMYTVACGRVAGDLHVADEWAVS